MFLRAVFASLIHIKSMIYLHLALHLPRNRLQSLRYLSRSQNLKVMIMSGMFSITDQRIWVNGTLSRILAPCAFISFIFVWMAFVGYLVSLIWLAETGLDYPLPLLTRTTPTPILSQKMRLMRIPTVCFHILILQLCKINPILCRGRVLQK